ncbi:MAG: hypothetical protein C0603_12470 [Denitrovibrio sp.]|nr:MAG: hypothetical protein C0603_12470 [Denitrovibrio sp.]
MKLDQLLEKINIPALKELIESETVYESKMMKMVFDDIDIISMPAIELYRLHFALFHALYTLQNEYVNDGKYLHIHFMQTGVFDYPADNKCAYFDKETMTFCGQANIDNSSHCALHSEQLGDDAIESLSLKYFYLDKQNYDKLDSVTAESLLSGAWEILSSENSLNDAYLALGLHGHENSQTVKIRFRELCKKYHPDNGGDRDKFMDINRSYRLIIKWLKEATSLS